MSHKVYMTFFVRQGGNVQFLEVDCRTSLPRKYTFTDPEKIRDIARQGQATSEALEALEHEIENGRGGMYLDLTPDQYAKLTKR
jgi:hypothetical protein